MAGRKTSIYLNPELDRLARDRGDGNLGEALCRGLSVTPLLVEENEQGGYTTHWYCEVPPAGTGFHVVREHWRKDTDEKPVREVYEIKASEQRPSG